MKCCRILGLCLLLTATAHGQSDTEPVPDLGSRTSDGFLVKCYWVGTFMMVEKFQGQGVTDLFGQAFSPVCGKSTTTASLIITEEVDSSGQRRAVVRAGTWASKFTGLHYWFKNGKRVAAGPGGSGGGKIPTSGEGAPNVSITYGENTASIHLGWTESDALAFDSKYLPLKFVTGGPNPLDIGPSGTHRQHLEVDTKEKTERRKAHVMGMMAIEEPVRAGRNTVIRQEWGDLGSDWYARWTMTRACELGKLKLVTPRGNPRTAPRNEGDGQNEFSFDWGSQGKLNLYFEASITPAEAINSVRDRVSFSIDPIGASVLTWDNDNPNGKASVEDNRFVARAQFKGLPAKNDDFGLKTVQLLLDGQLYEKTMVEIFFYKTAFNHPGSARVPNWFYYWQEGGVCGIDATVFFDASDDENFGYCDPPTSGSKVFLTENSPETNNGPLRYTSRTAGYGSVSAVGKGKGIKCVAETIEHERHHIWIYDQFHAGIAAAPDTDADKDGVPKAKEPALDGLRTDPDDPNTYNVPQYPTIGDDEVRCRKKELRLTIPYYPKKDWADPGCQSKERFGPD